MDGSAYKVGKLMTEQRFDRWATALLSKHAALGDFLRSPDCAVVVIEVNRLVFVTKFQQIVELLVRGGVLERVTPEAR